MKTVVSCKICGEDSPLYGVCDFNKSIEERHGFFLPLAGIPVWYHRCDHCGFIFTTMCDEWTHAEFRERIYNEDYTKIDPAWSGDRALNDAKLVKEMFPPSTLFDFGGGSGTLARILNSHGFTASSFDPFFDKNNPTGKAELVTCFEVFEHTPDPHGTLAQCRQLMDDDGQIFISTLAVDFLEPRALDNASGASFIAPRNGHISIHTRKSLETLINMHGMKLVKNDRIPKDEIATDIDRYFIAQRF
jgi:Methyltransferase domain